MPATMSPKGEELLAELPPYYESDPATRAILDSSARELQRVEDFLRTLMVKLRPTAADDEYRLLGLWEDRVGLPVEPAGVSVQSRRQNVLAALRRRNSGAGSGWVELINEVLNSTNWSHEENRQGPYRLSLAVPDISDYTKQQLRNILAQTAPGHLQVDLVISGVTFQVSSPVGNTM